MQSGLGAKQAWFWFSLKAMFVAVGIFSLTLWGYSEHRQRKIAESRANLFQAAIAIIVQEHEVERHKWHSILE